MGIVKETTMAKRTIMAEFQIDEISCVTRPAQEGALAAIIKQGTVAPPALTRPAVPVAIVKAESVTKDEPQEAGLAFALAAAEIRARDGCSRTAALSKARTERPDLFEKFQSYVPAVPVAKSTPAAVVEFAK